MDDVINSKRMKELGEAFMACIDDKDDTMMVIGTMAVVSSCLIRALETKPEIVIAANTFLTVFREALQGELDIKGG